MLPPTLPSIGCGSARRVVPRVQRTRSVFAVVALTSLMACHDDPQLPVGPAGLHVDTASASAAGPSTAQAPIGGIPGFAFLRPIAAPDPSTWGAFDGSLADMLAVEICEVRSGACSGPPLRRITDADPLPARLRVVTREDVYRAEWDTRDNDLDPRREYRLRIMAGTQEVGYADLLIVRKNRPDSTRCPTCVAVVQGSTLSIVFRLDEGVAARVGPAGGKVTLAAGNVTFDVPAGAVSGDVLFTAAPVSTLPPGGPSTVPGTAWDFGPSGIAFAKPVTVTINYDPSRIPAGLQESELRIHKLDNGTYVQQNAGSIDLVSHTASAQLTGFSIYVLLQRQFPGSTEDVQGPAISLIEVLDPATNTYSPSLTLNTSAADVVVRSRVSLTDDISGAQYIDVRLTSPTGRQLRFSCFPYPFRPPTSGSDTNGQWDCSATWQRYSEAGAWQVNVVILQDKALNLSYFAPTAAGVCDGSGQGARCMTAPPQLAVVSSPSDATPALVSAFEVSLDTSPRNYGPSVSVDASTGARPIVFRYHVLDALSGIAVAPFQDFYLELLGPSGQLLRVFSCTLAQGTVTDGYLECPLTMPQSAEVGTWRVQYAVVGDRVGNNGYYSGRGYRWNGSQLCDADGQCIAPPTVTVTSAGDAEAPALQVLAIDTTGATVTTTLGITDNTSGTHTVLVQYFSTTSNQNQLCYAARTAGTALNGTYDCQITFSQFAARGQWELRLTVWDAAGNLRTYFRRASDGYLCYTPTGGSAQVCQDFGMTDLVLQ
ncbi:MAG: hypothetical protein IT360_18960 [Gemmatimonadaceae bacterium]|nr:hypothetical protein [Gemmatimonadaceae bacterium]